MIHEEMTVHKALAELKTLDSRIQKAVRQGVYVTCKRHSDTKISGVNVSDYCTKTMQAGYDSAVDLIRRRNAIKRAVVLSNAKTEVVVAGERYTVAEAIDMKNHGLDGDVLLLSTMESQYAAVVHNINQNSGDILQKKAENYVAGMFGGKDKVDGEEAKKQMADYITANTYEQVDPLRIQDKIKALDEHISAFMAEVDGALSTSNALTTIEINY